MAWTDRLKEAAYTSPSGTRYTFEYENVSATRTKKTTAFEFPDADGTYVQESGSTGRTFPIQCIFWGADYDLQADAFDAALFEVGTGKLEHPIYGTIDVVPTGTVTRRDDLKTAANQAILEVTFMSTIGLVYPSAQNDPASELIATVDDFNAAMAGEFEENIVLDTAVEAATFKSQYEAILSQVSAGLAGVAATEEGVLSEFNAVRDSITRGLNTLVGEPLTLALQTVDLVQVPARSVASILAKLEGYKNLAATLVAGQTPTALNFYTKDLYASAYVTGAVLSTVNNQFRTRVDAISAASDILDQFDTVSAWKDSTLVALGLIDTGAAYQQLQKAVALTAGYLVEISFSLKQERRIILDRARTIVDLTAELYGEIDANLDFLIDSNDLSGSEILELPKGRGIVYYV